ncbi:c-type cytochrome [Ottowia testudinis]|uniref:Cytochrome c5 family protein n=1 Tax=Ottowia testudinis TaxID=2816950 RepID=A0A975CIC0_9BURK|nr:c-type cytochrome [Ottowia testudinis]QTD46302.1 cytochrome c5 family protein [Ottowia testudinis]
MVRVFLRRFGVLMACAALLAGCGAASAPTAADEARAEALRPADAVLAEKYGRSCAVCHTKIAANAPLTGFAAAWQPRLAKGMPTLLQSAQQGLAGMPAGGQCADCTPEQLQALIEFMAKGS